MFSSITAIIKIKYVNTNVQRYVHIFIIFIRNMYDT